MNLNISHRAQSTYAQMQRVPEYKEEPNEWLSNSVWPSETHTRRASEHESQSLIQSQGGLWGSSCAEQTVKTSPPTPTQEEAPKHTRTPLWSPGRHFPYPSMQQTDGGEGRDETLALQTVFIHSFDLQVSVFFLFPALVILFVVCVHLKTTPAERFRAALWARVPKETNNRESSQIIDDLDVGISGKS